MTPSRVTSPLPIPNGALPDPSRQLFSPGIRAGWLGPGRFGLLLLLVLAVVFPKVVLGLHSFVYRDYGVLGYPFVYHARESFWAGDLPLWNPLSNCGVPFLAQWGTMVVYPLALFYLIFPLPWSLSCFCLGHLVLGGMGMYLLAERWSWNRFAASLAGLVYVMNGVALSSLVWPNYTVALGWMPWVVWANERSWHGHRSRLVGAALLSAMQLFSGVPEMVLLTWLLLGALFVHHWFISGTSRAIALGRFLGVILLTAGLAAVQLLPFFDLLAHSQRDQNFSSAKWPMPAWGWANLLVPLFRCFETPQGPFFQYDQHFLSSYYLGAGVVVLVVWAAWSIRTGRVWILTGTVLLSMLLALGENGGVWPWLKAMVPGAGLARYPIKFVVLAAFVVPLLLACALSRLEASDRPARDRRSLFAAGWVAAVVIGCILWVAWRHPYPYDQWSVTWKNGLSRMVLMGFLIGAAARLSHPLTAAARGAWRLALAGVFMLDMLTHAPSQNPTVPVRVFELGLWGGSTSVPAPQHGQGRAFITPEAEEKLLNSGVADVAEDFLGKRLALWSNLNLLEGIPKLNGSSTLQLRHQMAVQKLIYDRTNTVPRGLLDFLGAAIETAPGNALEWIVRTNYAPLVTAGQEPLFATEAETLAGLGQPDFDGRRVVFLPTEAGTSIGITNRTRAEVELLVCAAGRLVFAVQAEEPSMVVIAQSFHHPWRARIDGHPARLWRANHAFQGMVVPAGRHEVTLAYQDANLKAGAGISVGSLLLCLASLRRSWKKPPGKGQRVCPSALREQEGLVATSSSV